MSAADNVLSRLEGVKASGASRWVAKCPAHADKRPSLSLRELDDGRMLLHCWAGCDVDAIVGALGLDMADLFPPKPQAGGGAPRERRPWLPADAFDAARHEVGVVFVIANDMHEQRVIGDADLQRLALAVRRLDEIGDSAYGRR